MRNPFTFGVGALLAVAIVSILSYAAIELAKRAPATVVRALLALTIALGAIPAILYALYGS
jgi:hypothetical protein